jgi:aryl-alcohol dehydrogenase-like predicted oxidoreductase
LQRGLEKSRSLVAVLEEMAALYNVTAAQVALNWVIHSHGDLVVTIPGVTRVSQARESAGAMNFQLNRDEIARLNKVSAAMA